MALEMLMDSRFRGNDGDGVFFTEPYRAYFEKKSKLLMNTILPLSFFTM
jgi:hypothetical protein